MLNKKIMFNKFIVVFIILLILIPVMIIGLTKPKSNFNTTKNSTIENVYDSAEINKQVSKKITVCSICHKTFTHNGYKEISDGVWRPQSDPYTSQICSINCGKKYTKKVHDLIDKVEDKYNNGIDTHSNQEYQRGNDGRIYETKKCSMCFGKGYTDYVNPANGQKESEICSMCEGAGHLSY